ncbi:MAG: hypothetical protein HQM02_01480 [Magnetococcales bacterium]|nr:hypothetical protein [Magnetococcales bacterium]
MEQEQKFKNLISSIVQRFEKKNAKLRKQAEKDKEAHLQTLDPTLAEQLKKVEEWKEICMKINDVAHAVGARLVDHGYPCSVSIAPTFHPDTHQTYSSQIVLKFAQVQLDDLAQLMYRKPFGNLSHKPTRDEVCAKALDLASCIGFVEDLANRQVIVQESVYSRETVTTVLSFDGIGRKVIRSILEDFIIEVFEVE